MCKKKKAHAGYNTIQMWGHMHEPVFALSSWTKYSGVQSNQELLLKCLESWSDQKFISSGKNSILVMVNHTKSLKTRPNLPSQHPKK